jgi:NAD(P)-dependent dehydrogenase (short-subunit alcohol dehydrogenase family)
MDDLSGKTMTISGVGPGLGRETALVAVREGANVVLGARTAAQLEAVAEECDPSGEKVATVVGDIALESTAEALVEAAMDKFGRVDSICHCAAYSAMGGLEVAGDFSDYRRAIEVNLIGGLQLARAALAQLKAHRGSIVFVSSQTQWFPPPEVLQMPYAASKGAIWGAMHHLALELGPHKIRVNEVAPGWMMGPSVESWLNWQVESEGITFEEAKHRLTKDMALGDFATDGDVAEAIVFMASDRAAGITGQTLLVNAGEFMH